MINTTRMTLDEIRVMGNEALLKTLGPVGMIRYLQQYERGRGDYSTERHHWLDGQSLETLIEQVRELEKLSPEE